MHSSLGALHNRSQVCTRPLPITQALYRSADPGISPLQGHWPLPPPLCAAAPAAAQSASLACLREAALHAAEQCPQACPPASQLASASALWLWGREFSGQETLPKAVYRSAARDLKTLDTTFGLSPKDLGLLMSRRSKVTGQAGSSGLWAGCNYRLKKGFTCWGAFTTEPG